MRRYRLNGLEETRKGHFLRSIIEETFISRGRMSFKRPGERTHSEYVHTHDEPEVFVFLQGRGRMEVNGARHPVEVGDIIVIEPGEDHHLVSDKEDPCIILWLHFGMERHIDRSPGEV